MLLMIIIQSIIDFFQACELVNSQNFGPSGNGIDFWQSERPKDMANIVDLEVMCGKRHMEVSVQFDKPFNGIIFSKVSKILLSFRI